MLPLKTHTCRVADSRHDWIQGFKWHLGRSLSPPLGLACCVLARPLPAFLMELQTCRKRILSSPVVPAEVPELHEPCLGCVPVPDAVTVSRT